MLKSVSRKLRTPSDSAVSVRRAEASERRTVSSASTVPAETPATNTNRGCGRKKAAAPETAAVAATWTPTRSATLPATLKRARAGGAGDGGEARGTSDVTGGV